MAYDAVKLKDWQISELAEEKMPTPDEWREKLGLQKDEIIPYGRLCKLDFLKIIERLKNKPDGKYIEVTAITPTPLGEGKSTTSCGLMEGLGKRGKNVGGCSPPAIRRSHHEYQGHCSRRRQCPAYPHDRVLHGPDRRYQRYYECPQPGHGSAHCQDAA